MVERNPWRNNIVVIDNGSSVMKVGIAGENTPRVSFLNVLGQTKTDDYNLSPIYGHREYVGKEAFSHAQINLSFPIDNGEIQSWDQMEKVWKHIFHF